MAPRDLAQSQASLCLGTTTALTALVTAHIQLLQLEVCCHYHKAVITMMVIVTMMIHYDDGNCKSTRMTQQVEPRYILICMHRRACPHIASHNMQLQILAAWYTYCVRTWPAQNHACTNLLAAHDCVNFARSKVMHVWAALYVAAVQLLTLAQCQPMN